jgi:hypothetical protein
MFSPYRIKCRTGHRRDVVRGEAELDLNSLSAVEAPKVFMPTITAHLPCLIHFPRRSTDVTHRTHASDDNRPSQEARSASLAIPRKTGVPISRISSDARILAS